MDQSMFTDAQIAKMTPKVNLAIQMAPTWDSVLSEEEYNKRFEALKKWVFQKKEVILEKYGKGSDDLFLKIIAPMDIIPFLKAGFQYHYDYLDQLIDKYHKLIIENYDFVEQPLTNKLISIRESVTMIALTINAIKQAKFEFGNDEKILKEKAREILMLSKDSLAILAKGRPGNIKYLDKIETEMAQNNPTAQIETGQYISALKSAKLAINKNVFDYFYGGFIVLPPEPELE